MKKRILSVFMSLCIVVAMLPAPVLAADDHRGEQDPMPPASSTVAKTRSTTWTGWSTIDYDGKTAGNPIALVLFDEKVTPYTSATASSSQNNFDLRCGTGYADTMDILYRLRAPYVQDMYWYEYDKTWPGEYAITFYSSSADGGAPVETMIDGKIQLSLGDSPIVSEDAALVCTTEQAQAGGADATMTVRIQGTFEYGWYYCTLSDINSGSSDQNFWLFAGTDGKLYDNYYLETPFEESVSSTCVPQLSLSKVTAAISSDQKTQSISISPHITIAGNGVEDSSLQEISFEKENGAFSLEYGTTGFRNAAVNSSTGGGTITYSSSKPSVATVDSSGEVTTINIGTTTITATAAAAGDYAETSVSYNLTVEPKEISAVAIVSNKQYDGTTKATVEVNFTGLVGEDTLTAFTDYLVTANFEDINAGTDKTVNVTVELRDTPATWYYTLSDGQITAVGSIKKADAKTLPEQNIHIQYDDVTAQSVSVAGLMPADAGTETYAIGTIEDVGEILADGVKVDERGNVTFRLRDDLPASASSQQAEIPVVITSTNYETSCAYIYVGLITDIVDSGTFGENFTWVLTNDGLLSINGTGDMPDWPAESPWELYDSLIQTVLITGHVTSIGSRAFMGCDSLVSLTLPNSVVNIGEYAFYECSSLTSLTLPDSVVKIGHRAFMGCSSLTSITLPNNVASIGDAVFMDCSSLSSITILQGLTNISYRAFRGCSNLASITMPDSITSIEREAFYECSSLTKITLPNSMTSIDGNAFYGCSNLEHITIPSSLNYFVDGVFAQCNKLVSAGPIGGEYNIQFAWAEGIPSRAFDGCNSLESVTLPDGLTSIGNQVFSNCANLESITLPDGLTSIGDSAFYRCIKLKSIILPDSLTSIGHGVFSDCSSLASITLPDGLTSIGNGAFNGCSGLKDVYYAGSEAQWEQIEIGDSNDPLNSATIHYNSIGPDEGDPGDSDTTGSSIRFFSSWNPDTKQAFFGNNSPAYSVAETVDISAICALVGKYVLVETDQVNVFQITSMKPVESKIGTVLDVGENLISFETGVYWPTSSNLILSPYEGKTVLYHIYENKIVAINILEERTGTFDGWDSTTGTVTISGTDYQTNYVTDLSFLANLDQILGTQVGFYVILFDDYSCVLKIDSYQTETGIFSHYDPFSDTAYISGKEYRVDSSVCVPDNNILQNRDVFYLLKAGTIVHIDAFSNLKAELQLTLQPVKFTVNYQNKAYDKDSFQVKVVATNRVDYDFPDGYDTAVIFANPAFQSDKNQITLTGVAWQTTEGPEFLESGEIVTQTKVLKVGERVTETSNIVLKTSYIPEEQTESGFVTVTISGTQNGTSITAQGNITFELTNKDYGQDSDDSDIGKTELSFWDEHFLKALYEIEDVNVTATSCALSTYFDKSTVQDIGRTVLFWQAARESEFAANTKGQLPEYLEISCEIDGGIGINAKRNGHNATLLFWNNSILNWNTGNFGQTSFMLIDDTTGSILEEEGLYQVTVSASAKNFADGIKTYLSKEYGKSWIDFCKTLGHNAVQEIMGDVATITGKEYLNSMLDILNNIKIITDNAKKFTDYAGQASEILRTPMDIAVKSGGEVDKYVKRMTAKCPVDVYVYNPQGKLCGAIENNKIVIDTLETFIEVTGDQKTVWLSDKNYTVSLVSRDEGIMDYTIDEYALGEDTRTVAFNDVPLSVGLSYQASIPEKLNVPASEYALTSNTGKIIYADSDTNESENSPVDEGTSPGGISGNESNSSVNYLIAIQTEIENGSIRVKPTRAERGDTVTITAIPDPGYEVDEIIVADRNGCKIPVRDIGSNRYTFKMPSGQVKVDATFVRIEGTAPQIIFQDVIAGTYYYDAVLWAIEQGITSGVTATTFNPNGSCTRAQIVTFLWRANGSPAPQTAMNPFTDISPDAYYYDAVLWAAEQGITSGTTATSFNPNKACTRAQAVTFLWRSEGSPATDNSSFNDVPDGTYYADAVDWAVANNVTQGITTNTFVPSNTCTRAQIVTFLYRTLV